MKTHHLVTALAMLACAGCATPLTSMSPRREEPARPRVGIHLAALRGDVGTVRQHVAAGTALDAKDQFGSTPLAIAITFGQTEAAEVLLEAGADPSIVTRDDSAPLHLAAFFAHPKLVRALLNHGADKWERNGSGATAFDLVVAPFEPDVPVYDRIAAALGPLGLKLDYATIKAKRPEIAKLLEPDPSELGDIQYAPVGGRDWRVSTPEAQGLDPRLVAELYADATHMDKLLGLLIVKDGQLVAERYFNGSAIDTPGNVQSVTKSFTSAMVGIALERGCLSSLDQKLFDFFPEQAGRLEDDRKRRITIRQMLEMRGGYPWEETKSELWDLILTGSYLDGLVDVALVNDPGTAFNYSNLTSHWLGVIVSRACETHLRSFAEAHIFAPMGAKLGNWLDDRDGYAIGMGEMQLTARDMAKFGLMYLDGGQFDGNQVVPAAWVEDSLRQHSDDAWIAQPAQHHVGRYFRDLGYGYQWWSAMVQGRRFSYAAGHGGQLVILLRDLNMLVVATSDPFYMQHDDEAWKSEQATYNLVGKFIRSLPQPAPTRKNK